MCIFLVWEMGTFLACHRSSSEKWGIMTSEDALSTPPNGPLLCLGALKKGLVNFHGKASVLF